MMAQRTKAVLESVATSKGGNQAKSTASSEAVTNALDNKKLNEIFGYNAELNKGVYRYAIGRPDVKLTEHGMPITTLFGFNTWAAFQGKPCHDAIAGDFTLMEDEVGPVIIALIENGIEVVAVHSSVNSHEFFSRYWGLGNTE